MRRVREHFESINLCYNYAWANFITGLRTEPEESKHLSITHNYNHITRIWDSKAQ